LRSFLSVVSSGNIILWFATVWGNKLWWLGMGLGGRALRVAWGKPWVQSPEPQKKKRLCENISITKINKCYKCFFFSLVEPVVNSLHEHPQLSLTAIPGLAIWSTFAVCLPPLPAPLVNSPHFSSFTFSKHTHDQVTLSFKNLHCPEHLHSRHNFLAWLTRLSTAWPSLSSLLSHYFLPQI
jgi:hypothetical protein